MGKTINMTTMSSSKRSLRKLPRLSGGAVLLLALLLVSTLILAQRLGPFHTLPHDLAVTPADHTTVGADAFDRLGSDVAVGDFNGDGIDDVLVSADIADAIGNAKSSAGEAYVIFGSAAFGGVTDLSVTAADLRIVGADVFDLLFHVGAGDVNGDGFAGGGGPDCDDDDTIFPGAVEIADDGIDLIASL